MLGNKYKGEVEFKAGEESWVLRFSANAVVGIEEAFDKSIRQLGDMMADPDKLRMGSVKRMFCIGLVDHYAETRPDMDDAKAQMIFGRLSPIEATQVVVRAFTAAFDMATGGQAAADANPPAAASEAPPIGTGPAS